MMALKALTTTQIISQLSSGFYWTGSSISFAVPTLAGNTYGSSEKTSFTGLSAAQSSAFTLAIGLWADLIAKPVVSVGTTKANITVGNFYDGTGRDYAHTYFPAVGTVWLNTFFNGVNYGATNDLLHPAIGMHGFATYIHELGHAFGLNHAGNYNAGAGTPAPGSYQDSTVYSIMSYFGPSMGDGIDPVTHVRYSSEIAWGNWGGYDAQTPMLNDILAMQKIYGVSTTTRTGDTTYGFHSSVTGAEAALYDFAINMHPVMCIFDSSGNDTLDLSGDANNDVINLNAGAFSNVMGLTNNLSIAYSALIENATGGAGDDTIIGNAANNRLYGGAGNDIISGGAGADYLDGGTGTNTLNYATSALGVTINLDKHTAAGGDAQGDSFLSFQNVTGSATGANTLIGDANANVLAGGAANDLVSGGAGADRMDGAGGNNTLSYASSLLGVTINLATHAAAGGDAQGDSFTNFQNVIGSATGANTLTGDAGANLLTGGAGNDTIAGGAGADKLDGLGGINTLDYGASLAGVSVNLSKHSASGGDAQGDTFLNFQNIIGSATGANTLTGDAAANVLTGGAGKDFLEGLAGNDTLTGGLGADIFAFLAGDSGKDEIRDFALGSDHIQLSKLFAASFSSLHFTSVDGNTVLAFAKETIQIDNVVATSLHATDFIFV